MTDGVATQKTSAMTACTKDTMDTVTKGQLTIGTDNPAYPPWFIDNTPSNGKGYESAVGFAIAKQLGYSDSEVKWITVAFNNAITPGKKNFDFDLNQVSISAEREKAVDFSSGYYDVTQTVVTYKGSPIASAKTVADLKGAKLGAQVGTTSYNAITNQIKPTAQPSVFDTNDLAVQALKNHQIDGIVVDLPTAFYMTSAQLTDGVIVGQLPVVGQPEQFGAVLTKGSPLTQCVSMAVDALRKDGTLEKLQTTWLASQGAPKLTE
ncbi:amino acid ABC transporter substrate-binding protein (PAAT family) [Branchiibius hedensis]|uniref:Amino acid ABC transporter substrate-binding protein, PAAT family n=1 Tax=Branchiibius hedensis TaxID=672460 RepID=A0A2Y8ZU35_9MICO|nr:ABC transporter substrate-binding protein [Branchiibius hedensis]PWJ26703.1 amino acid ABC transporter substrate-binding protein (PAAT family) [Branchiibius hedensis]SSA35514.1 amino acid ABC transporter substrate-binding protein, PAAT family [Branchiibius hedensis]